MQTVRFHYSSRIEVNSLHSPITIYFYRPISLFVIRFLIVDNHPKSEQKSSASITKHQNAFKRPSAHLVVGAFKHYLDIGFADFVFGPGPFESRINSSAFNWRGIRLSSTLVGGS